MGVTFDEKPITAARSRSSKTSFFTKLFIKMGLAKDEKGAQIIMLVITILAIIGMAALLPSVLSSEAPTQIIPVNDPVYRMP